VTVRSENGGTFYNTPLALPLPASDVCVANPSLPEHRDFGFEADERMWLQLAVGTIIILDVAHCLW
jgi:hypothetical protein